MKKKDIVIDMILNIVATAIPTIFLQLIILPSVSRHVSDERYGLLVTVLALLNVVPATMGNVLNNIRLLYNEKYISEKQQGDFNLLLLIFAVLNFFCVSLFLIYYDHELTIGSFLFTLIVSVLWLYREYFIVAFRLVINYRAILYCNVMCVVGYAVGYAMMRTWGMWQWIYLWGFLFSLIYCFVKSDLWKEPYCKTRLFKQTGMQSILLLIAKVLNRVITYADKIIIFPILGGTVVSVYYAATVFGKVVSLMITPVNSVALTYLARVKVKKDHLFINALLSGGVICVLGYFLCLGISRPVLTILYPQFVDEAMKYIDITTGTTVLYALISIVDPFIMKFFDMKWQIVINGGTVGVYLILGISLLKKMGLRGFCIGALLTNILKLIFMILIYFQCRTLKQERIDS